MTLSIVNNKNNNKRMLFSQSPFLYENQDIEKEKDFSNIYNCLVGLVNNGSISLMDGYCLTASETIRMALKSVGIESRLYECQLTISYYDVSPVKHWFIGFDGIRNNSEVDTHVVVITETNPPFLIDGSISSKIPIDYPIFVEKFKEEPDSSGSISSYDCKRFSTKLTYQSKINQKMPRNFQMSIVERINTDQKIFKNIEMLKKLNYIGIGLSIFAVIGVLHQFIRWWVL